MAISALLDVVPILMLLGLGMVLRATGLIDHRSGLVLTKLAYHVTIPAAIFTSIARAPLTGGMLLLPLAGLLMPCALAGIAYVATPWLAHRPGQRGALLVSMVVMGVFGYPFFQLFFGSEGLARMAMYDVGNALYAGTVAMWLAQRFGALARDGTGEERRGLSWAKVVTSPVLLASVLGVLASALRVPLVGPLGGFLDRLTAANTPLAMIAVGVFVRPRLVGGRLLIGVVVARLVAGPLLGALLALAWGMHGLDMITTICAPLLPVGTTALVYAGNEGLDTEFCAALISLTAISAAIASSVMPLLLKGALL